MPLIRYRVGDRATLAADQSCACGRGMPVLESIDGRCDDVIVTPDGRQIGRLDPALKGDLPVREVQIIQEAPATVRILYVPGDQGPAAVEAPLKKQLRNYLGEMQFEFEAVARIPRAANGKMKAVVCRLTPAQRAAAAAGHGA
jgi:phenylacetate-CoA ligase